MILSEIQHYINTEGWLKEPSGTGYRINDPCAYCAGQSSTWDHIIPESSRPKYSNLPYNKTRACAECNKNKRSHSALVYFACLRNNYPKKGKWGFVTPRTPKVVHVKKDRFDVYIGRPGKWGNPYSHLDDSKAKFKVNTREEAIDKYKEHLYNNPELLRDIHELKGKVLGCWCAPLPCHGEVLLQLANEELEDVNL